MPVSSNVSPRARPYCVVSMSIEPAARCTHCESWAAPSLGLLACWFGLRAHSGSRRKPEGAFSQLVGAAWAALFARGRSRPVPSPQRANGRSGARAATAKRPGALTVAKWHSQPSGANRWPGAECAARRPARRLPSPCATSMSLVPFGVHALRATPRANPSLKRSANSGPRCMASLSSTPRGPLSAPA